MQKSGKCSYKIGVNVIHKKKYLKPERAIKEAERLNKLPNTIKKFKAYKCTTCLFFHVGRSHDDITEKKNIFIEEIKPIEEIKVEPVGNHDEFDWETDKKIL